jgi:hypothetical protein
METCNISGFVMICRKVPQLLKNNIKGVKYMIMIQTSNLA